MEFPYMLKSHSTQCKDMFFSDSVIQLAKNNSIKYPELTNRNFFATNISTMIYITIL